MHRCRLIALLLMCFTTAAVATSMSPGELIEAGVTRLTKQIFLLIANGVTYSLSCGTMKKLVSLVVPDAKECSAL